MEEQPGTEQKSKVASRRLGLDKPSLTVESASFRANQPIPRGHAGANGRSPALRWSKPPPRTQELVILAEDPDAPTEQPFVHWIVTGLSPSTTELPEGLPPSGAPLGSGAVQGRNDMRADGYYGPEPPPGHGVHHYHFQVFAVDEPLDLEAPVGRDALVEALRGHVMAWGELVGTYQR
jgi:Raf kinase inhibitor-like YbhB/YbcL family protein